MSTIKKISKKRLVYIIISFIIFALISVLAFSKVKFSALAGTFDMQFHLRRILELKEAIEHGHLFPEFSFNFFHGVPIMDMYPYLSIYPFALLLFIVPSFIKSYYIFVIITTFITLLVSFFSSLKYSKSILISYLFAVTYGVSSTFVFEFFATGDLGITSSLIVLPLAIFGFLDILYGFHNYLKLSFGLILLLSCQLSLFTITIAFLIFWYVVNIKSCSKSINLNYIKAIIFSVLITSIIWIPIFYITLTTRIHSLQDTSIIAGASTSLFFENVGLIAPFAIVISIFYFKHFCRTDKQMYLLSILICIISSKFMPWAFISHMPIIKLINQFQFACRFLIIPFILLCYLFAECVTLFIQKFSHNIHNTQLLIGISLVFIILLQLSTQAFELHHKFGRSEPLTSYYIMRTTSKHGHYSLINNNSTNYLIHGYFANNDYYPKESLPIENQVLNNDVMSDNDQISKLHVIKYNKFNFYNEKFSKSIILPFVYYNNENIKLYINHSLYPFHVTKHNRISINNIKQGNNILNIKYIPNKNIELCKYVLFTLGILWCGYYILCKLYN